MALKYSVIPVSKSKKYVIRRRYENGLKNFFTTFKEIVDDWMFIDNSGEPYQIIAEGAHEEEEIGNATIWYDLTNKYDV